MTEALTNASPDLLDTVGEAARPLTGATADYDPLLDLVGDSHTVLLGEASHGTHEFYRARAEITKRLIREKGFTAVAVEADWPDAYRVNCYVRGAGSDQTALEALGDFERFPTWMWRNADVLEFVGWLPAHNDQLPRPEQRVGFYGVDLSSLCGSIQSVVRYLDKVDPEAATRARYRHGCFDDFGEDTQAYGYVHESPQQRSHIRRNLGNRHSDAHRVRARRLRADNLPPHRRVAMRVPGCQLR